VNNPGESELFTGRGQAKEDFMKKLIILLSLSFLIVFLIFTVLSCTPEEKIIEKQSIQISDQDLREKNVVEYKTREFMGKKRTYLTSDLSRIPKPASLDEFSTSFHNPPVRQWWTSTCWSYATISMLESELKRLGIGELKLSEMFIAYWEFVEKARGFIQKKGGQLFTGGSEHNAVFERMKQYGIVPTNAYTGLLPGKTEHDHSNMFKEMRNYLTFCKENEYWDEDKAVDYIKSILDKYMGKPPETVDVDGKTMTPKKYLDNVLKLRLEDYVSFMSFKSLPFYTQGEFKVADNWWHSQDYYNVPLDVFYSALVSAMKEGYTVALGGDTSEPGKSGADDIAIIPTFDIHPKLIDQDSREFRFNNRTSTDDHAIHAVGYKEDKNHTWFLVKDSGSSSQKGQFKGYYFFRDDYVKLKMLVLTMHRDAAKDILAKFKQ
jgi:bleomycin hydrolase